jgi:transposase-like protein
MSTAKHPKLTIVPRQLDSEVQPSTTRPNWTAAEKLAILQEYESYPRGAPERGALLRRKGIYTSHISKWRQQRNRGALTALSPQPRGPKREPPNPLADEVARLQQENARLQARLATAEAVIEIQKKVAQLLGTSRPTQETSEP